MTESKLHKMVGEILYDLFEHGIIPQPDEKRPDYGIGTKCITEVKNCIRLNLEESKNETQQ